MEAFENLQQVVTDNILVEDVMKDEEIPRNEILGKEEQNEEVRLNVLNFGSYLFPNFFVSVKLKPFM